MCAQESRFIQDKYERVFEEAQNALLECGFRIRYADFNSGVINCSAGESERAWFGEKLEIFISRMQNGVQINIRSSAKGPMPTTFGKSSENIEDFFFTLNRRLQQVGGQVPAPQNEPLTSTIPPPPSPRCHVCNEAVRYVPQYSRWFCDKCQRYFEDMDVKS